MRLPRRPSSPALERPRLTLIKGGKLDAVVHFMTPEEIQAYDPVTWNEDWPKTLFWDLPTDIETLGQLLGISKDDTPAQRAETWANFLKLPASVPMPDDLRRRVEQVVLDAQPGAVVTKGLPMAADWIGRIDLNVDPKKF